ncbi:MAG: hypothetical protein HQK58_00620 [Deltaproteobacteria bacterium]|nr:hypothetical protein [Deltaproteobacteria bacterium]
MPKRLKPTPRALKEPLQFHQVDKSRFLDCPHYDHCLTLGEQKKWLSFTCRKCPFFLTKTPPGPQHNN